MRSTRDLIAELRAEAADGQLVALAVGFTSQTKLVFSTKTDAEAQRELDALVMQGGYPLGFIRSIRKDSAQVVESRPLTEYVDDPVPAQLLREICERMADSLERQFGVFAYRKNGGQE